MKNTSVYNGKFDEYVFNFFLTTSGVPVHLAETVRAQNPVAKFDIGKIMELLAVTIEEDRLCRIESKLRDIKMIYSFLFVTNYELRPGYTLVVGNDEVEKLNPNTIHLLRINHHRVYLLSVLTESLLDLLQLIIIGKIKDYKKNKWSSIYKSLLPKVQTILPESEFGKLMNFKDVYRTGELHKFSPVRQFLSKEKWDHFQAEQEILESALQKLPDVVSAGI